MPSFWTLVNKVIEEADVLLLVLDARLVQESRNIELERKVQDAGKPFIYVISKSDLAEAGDVLQPSIAVSSKDYRGIGALKRRILTLAKKQAVIVGVLGYPNVGKSSLINSLKGKGSASVSPLSGHTRGLQKVRVGKRIMLIDTPGVIPYNEKDFMKQSVIGTIDYLHVREPDVVVSGLMQRFPEKFEKFYDTFIYGSHIKKHKTDIAKWTQQLFDLYKKELESEE